MAEPEEIGRLRAARQEAYELGYMLLVDEAINVEPMRFMAFAGRIPPQGQAGTARFLTLGETLAGTAEAGLAVLRGVVERGEPWPS